MERKIAKDLLDIQAVFLRPNDPLNHLFIVIIV